MSEQLDLLDSLQVDELADAHTLLAVLQQWQQAGWLRPLDVGFARLIAELAQEQGLEAEPVVMLLAALVSHQVGRGHVCMDLAELLQHSQAALDLPPQEGAAEVESLLCPAELLAKVSLSHCLETLQASPLVSDGGAVTPLVLQQRRLYLRRLWRYEQHIARAIRVRLAPRPELESATSPQSQALAEALAQLFPESQDGATDYQKLACALAARSRFAVITGGPGTGKTTTVVKLLAALQKLAAGQQQSYRIRLAAPTGKAAARLNESIAGAVSGLQVKKTLGIDAGVIPTQVTTLHRLLGSRPDTRQFRHHQDNPLPLDILVIDEASMVDVDLMAAVMAALPPNAQLILLGDKDQLASVDAGAVLGELCQRAVGAHYRPDTADWLQAVTAQSIDQTLVDDQGTALDQAVAMLRVSYRFRSDSGIRELAQMVNAGEVDDAILQRCRQGYADVTWLTLNAEPELAQRQLAEHALHGSPQRFAANSERVPVGYQHYLTLLRQHGLTADDSLDAWKTLAQAVLNAFGQFQLLCALRQGPWGVEGLNQTIAEQLQRRGLIERSDGWYTGRPVLITANDYNLGLMNGDVGIAMMVPVKSGGDVQASLALRVVFADGQGGVRWISPSRLQQLETVFAMTVHKSQGSEFDHTCLVLPDRISPVLSKELIYTGITRAKHWFSLVTANDAVVKQAIAQRIQRASGLRDAIQQS